jgi:hypothetical protein
MGSVDRNAAAEALAVAAPGATTGCGPPGRGGVPDGPQPGVTMTGRTHYVHASPAG